jgi:hypothetical protein
MDRVRAGFGSGVLPRLPTPEVFSPGRAKWSAVWLGFLPACRSLVPRVSRGLRGGERATLTSLYLPLNAHLRVKLSLIDLMTPAVIVHRTGTV